MSELKKVYFAGKVSKGGGYRGKLLGNSRVMSLGYAIYDVAGGRLVYGGPFALSCDHGCFHSEGKHGLLRTKWGDESGTADGIPECDDQHHGTTTGLTRSFAASRCIEQVQGCHAVHAYLDTVTCYGTLAELGYASAIQKPIYIYYSEKAQNWQKHFWFIFHLPSINHCGPGDETSIHPDLIVPAKSYKKRYHEYLASPEWSKIRELKLEEAGGRCQLCNGNGVLNVHHRTYDRVFREELRDLIVLCKKCHQKFHDVGVQ